MKKTLRFICLALCAATMPLTVSCGGGGQKALTEAAEQMNKRCPIPVDQFTNIEKVTVEPNMTLVYDYSIHGFDLSDVSVDEFKQNIKQANIQAAKSNPSVKPLTDKYDITFIHRYTAEDGTLFAEVKITPEMYK